MKSMYFNKIFFLILIFLIQVNLGCRSAKFEIDPSLNRHSFVGQKLAGALANQSVADAVLNSFAGKALDSSQESSESSKSTGSETKESSQPDTRASSTESKTCSPIRPDEASSKTDDEILQFLICNTERAIAHLESIRDNPNAPVVNHMDEMLAALEKHLNALNSDAEVQKNEVARFRESCSKAIGFSQLSEAERLKVFCESLKRLLDDKNIPDAVKTQIKTDYETKCSSVST
jgi:hypothetical protein